MIYIFLGGAVLFIFLQGFFAASEISFISSSLLKLRHRARMKDKRAQKAYSLLSQPERFLVTTLVGTNISVVISSSLLTFLLLSLGVANSGIWITAFFTPLVVIFAELLPKNIGRAFREEFSCWAAELIAFFERLFSPILAAASAMSKLLIKVFIGGVRPRSPFVTKEEIKLLVKEMAIEGGIDRGEKEAIEEVFEFRQDRIKDVGVSLKKVAGLNYTLSYDNVLDTIKRQGYTRYPVFRNRDIIGYINAYDLFYNTNRNWHSFIRKITKVGTSQKLYEVFTALKAKKESIALVLKGKKVWGIVTIQDLMDEIITSIVKI